jgi:hypothetical protein
MSEADTVRAQRFAAAVSFLEEELEWEELGRLLCHEGGESFFPPEQVAALMESWLRFAGELVVQLPVDGRSLYVGAGVFELGPMLADAIVGEREVVAVTLPGEEADLLNRGLVAAAERVGVRLPTLRTEPLAELAEAGFDLGWLVSVLSDPEAFPALHDHVYERGTPAPAALAVDRARARKLADELLLRLRPDALLATTDEELPIVREAVAASGLGLDVPAHARLTGVVGDPVRLCRLVPGV